MEEPNEHRTSQLRVRRRSHARGWIALAAILVLLGVASVFGALYFRSRAQLRQALHDSPNSVATETSALISKISVHMVLPSEKPTIAIVEDAKKLASQSFFKHAQNGDRVLVYTKSKKAILYRPSQDKVIEVAYLNTSASTTTATDTKKKP
ncbi:MAG TPA: hypothetical protein VLI54_00970 [Bacillota bacterium]|nr:hypothetical protein [Bacillota bacterium]